MTFNKIVSADDTTFQLPAQVRSTIEANLRNPATGEGDAVVDVADSRVMVARQNGILSPNYIINGGFDVWQRGTTVTGLGVSASFGADRWRLTSQATGTNCTVTRVNGPSAGTKYGARYLQTTSASSIVEYAARQFFETQNVSVLSGKIVTLSFWYRSNRVGNHSARVSTNTRATGGFDQNQTFPVSVANTWEKYSLAFNSFASITAWTAADNDWGSYVDIGFRTGPSIGDFATLNANDYFEIAGVQLEEGSVATPFRRNSPNLQAELAACQRYFWASSFGNITGTGRIGRIGGVAGSTQLITPGIRFPVAMRKIPSIYIFTDNVANRLRNSSTGSYAIATSPSFIIDEGGFAFFYSSTPVFTTGTPYDYDAYADAEL